MSTKDGAEIRIGIAKDTVVLSIASGDSDVESRLDHEEDAPAPRMAHERSEAARPARVTCRRRRHQGGWCVPMTHATNGIKFTQLERQRFKRIRYDGSDQPTPRR